MTSPSFSSREPIVRTGMLIRRSAADVFRAFVDPSITTRFWFTKASGPLAAGSRVRWDWEMYGISVPVAVEAFEASRRLRFVWGEGDDATTVDLAFEPRGEDRTFVTVAQSGFRSEGDALVEEVLASMGGFSLVLAGAKVALEHDVAPRLVEDRFPDGH